MLSVKLVIQLKYIFVGITKMKRKQRPKRHMFRGLTEGSAIVDWLNDKNCPAGDPTKRLVRLNEILRDPVKRIELEDDVRLTIQQHIYKTIRKWRIKPVLMVTVDGLDWE